MSNIAFFDKFIHRHLGPNEEEAGKMLTTIGCSSLDQLINETVPEAIRLQWFRT